MGHADLVGYSRALLDARGIERPDGRPLYAYRFTKAEYDGLAELLRQQPISALANWTGATLTVAYIAEWFRRDRGGGHWDWIRPLRSIGFDYGPGRPLQYADVENFVRIGLNGWRRPLPQGGERLLAIVRESGFPVAALREDRRIGAWLRHSVLCAERGFAVDQAVAAEAGRISDRLAQALVAPAIELCGAIVHLRAGIPSEERARDPVAYLDAHDPNWRDALPFDLEQEDVRSLVEEVVRARERGASALGLDRRLIRGTKGEWAERASLNLEGAVDTRRLPHAIAVELAERRRLRLFPRPPLSQDLAAIAAIETWESEDGLVHEVRPFVTGFDAELSLDCEARILVQGGHSTIGEFVPSGGQALDGPVIAFEVTEVDEDQEPRVLRAIGASSCQTTQPRLALAVRPDLLPSIEFSVRPRELGTCEPSGRRIVLFEGAANFVEAGVRWRWHTSAERTVDARASLVGELLPNVRETIYRGVPQIWVERDGHAVSPRRSALAWRPRGKGDWRPLDGSSPAGAVEFAVMDGADVQHAVAANVVPARVQVAFDRRRREIRIEGLGAKMLAAFAEHALRIRSEEDADVVELGPPGRVPVITLRARWENEIAMTLADPGYELRLIDEADQLLAPRASFALDGLGGKRILATREVSLCLELRSPDAPRFSISRDVTGDVPLSALRDTVRQLLGRSGMLDARVHVSALGAAEELATIGWYSDEIDPFTEAPRGPFAILATVQALNLRAVSMTTPAAGTRTVTGPAPQSAMRAQLRDEIPDGPWLVFGTRRTGEVIRPRVVPIDRRPGPGASPLVRAIAVDSGETRCAAIANVLDNATAMAPEDLRILVDLLLLARREGIPLSGIDAVRILDDHPSTAVFVLAACDDLEERAALLDLQRDLPFLWCATTIASWLSAFEGRADALRSSLTGTGLEVDIADRLTMTALRDITGLRPELAGHVRAVYLSTLAAKAARGEQVDASGGAFLNGRNRIDARTEIGRMITRHGEGPSGLRFAGPVLARYRALWEPFDPAFGDVIVAPFAAADHATGSEELAPSDVARCRDASLYDPEYFELIVPLRTNAILERIAQTGGTMA